MSIFVIKAQLGGHVFQLYHSFCMSLLEGNLMRVLIVKLNMCMEKIDFFYRTLPPNYCWGFDILPYAISKYPGSKEKILHILDLARDIISWARLDKLLDFHYSFFIYSKLLPFHILFLTSFIVVDKQKSYLFSVSSQFTSSLLICGRK